MLETYWNMFETCWKHAGKMLETCWNLLETCWKPVENEFETCRKPVGNLMETCWKPAGNLLETSWKPAGNLLETCCKPPGNLLETCWSPAASKTRPAWRRRTPSTFASPNTLSSATVFLFLMAGWLAWGVAVENISRGSLGLSLRALCESPGFSWAPLGCWLELSCGVFQRCLEPLQ